jgi:hypothetical protein
MHSNSQSENGLTVNVARAVDRRGRSAPAIPFLPPRMMVVVVKVGVRVMELASGCAAHLRRGGIRSHHR